MKLLTKKQMAINWGFSASENPKTKVRKLGTVKYHDLMPEGRQMFGYLKEVLIKQAQAGHLKKCSNWILAYKTPWSLQQEKRVDTAWRGWGALCFAVSGFPVKTHKPSSHCTGWDMHLSCFESDLRVGGSQKEPGGRKRILLPSV